MKSDQIRQKFLDFFKARQHAILPSASLVPENDPSVLFTTAGMQPLAPFLLGEKHPEGARLASVQKCVRTQDIEIVGDNTHDTFFEMLGNWSLGDYWKEESINWSYEFLTSKETGLGLDPRRLYVTVFEGNDDAPRDDVAHDIWKNIFEKVGVSGARIYFLGAKTNWWSAGDNGPCGPDTEMFYDITGALTEGMTKDEYLQADLDQKVVEIWNNVFMEYVKKDGKVTGRLPQRNVDTGAGLERLAMVMQGTQNVFDIDLFAPIMSIASGLSSDKRSQKIIADHIRTSVFLIVDGVRPSNTDRGYILRRLLRRAIFRTDGKNINPDNVESLVGAVAQVYGDVYKEIGEKAGIIEQVINEEVSKFKKTLADGLKQFEKISSTDISGKDAFTLFSTFGFPIDMTIDLAKEKEISVDRDGFDVEFKQHQDISRSGAEQKFKGGLADTDEKSVRYHTATHLLHQALRDVLGTHVKQKGSNITAERLRFDFTHPQKMTDEEKKRVEDIVNEKIKSGMLVQSVVLPKDQAEKSGARHLFSEKYGDNVNIYFVGESLDTAYSKEFCGGPHVKNTSELGHFKISKEEAISSGVRRIKAVLA